MSRTKANVVSLVEIVEVGNRLQFQADAAECSDEVNDEVEALDRKRNVPKHEQVLSQPDKVFEIEYKGDNNC